MKKQSTINEKGLTLLELLFGLLISVVVIGLSLPHLAQSLNKSRAVSDSKKFEHKLLEALTRAQSRGTNQKISLQRDRYIISRPERKQKTELILLNKSCHITGTSFPRDLFFYTSGAVTPITVQFKDETTNCKVTLSLRGRITRECKS